jgi:hypothetical protein
MLLRCRCCCWRRDRCGTSSVVRVMVADTSGIGCWIRSANNALGVASTKPNHLHHRCGCDSVGMWFGKHITPNDPTHGIERERSKASVVRSRHHHRRTTLHWIGLELWLLMVVAMLWLCGFGLDWLRALAISHASRHQPNVHASLKAPRNPTPNATQPRGWRIRRLMAFGGDDGRDASHDFAVGCSGLRLDDWLFVG